MILHRTNYVVHSLSGGRASKMAVDYTCVKMMMSVIYLIFFLSW